MTQQQSTETTTVSMPTTQQVTQRTKVITPTVEIGSPQKTYETKKAIFRSYQIIWYIVGVIEVLLAFRLILRLLGANPNSGFTNFVYTLSGPFALPFSGILGSSADSGLVLEWSTLIAMVVYTVLAYGIIELLQLVKPTTPHEVEQTVDNQ